MSSQREHETDPVIVLVDDDELNEAPGEQGPESTTDLSRPEKADTGSQFPQVLGGSRLAPRGRGRVRWWVYLLTRCGALIALGLMLTLGISVLRRGFLAGLYPSPGELSRPHAGMGALSGVGCTSCHDDAGMTEGCLGCHQEIAEQLSGGEGYHAYLMKKGKKDCSQCHSEHRGAGALLVDKLSWSGQDLDSFRHPHVEFLLGGAHRTLDCEACHEGKIRDSFTLPAFPSHPRQHTFFGLEQRCAFCHEDIHSGGLSEDCASCHGQDSFRPAIHFDHSRYFSLDGGHSQVACDGCHVIPERDGEGGSRLLPFSVVRGKACLECHESPHRTSLSADCESCHESSSPSWSDGREGMTVEIHALTGFRLLPQHAGVECGKCHDPALIYEERFPDPASPGYLRAEDTCRGCHADAHGGQFAGEHTRCLECHDRQRFQPHRFTPQRHALVYPLENAHAGAECRDCHKEDPVTHVRVFVGTPRECESCHEDPHGGQFASSGGDCKDCHDTRSFLPSLFSHARHEAAFPLTGAHRDLPCASCHSEDATTEVKKFAGTSTSCKSCHENPHGAQFQRELAHGDCTACHRGDTDTFAIQPFDHEALTGYRLVGAHAEARCDQCHLTTQVAADTDVASGSTGQFTARVYRKTSTECSSCHRDQHRGQFRRHGETTCSNCHASTARWTAITFDHDTQARFPLEGAHSALPCSRCHPAVKQADGVAVIQYKPLGVQCQDCHVLSSR